MTLDPVTVGLMGEGIKLGMQLLFTQLTLLGKTPEEINVIFFREFEEFEQNKTAFMPDV